MDFSKPIEIAKDIFWVGYVIPNDPFQCHVYLIKNGKESVLIDPGSMITFPITMQKITSIMPLDDIKYIILHHQDPDIVGCVSTLETIMSRDDKVFITHWRTQTLLKHYQWKTPFWLVDENDWRLTLEGGRELEFVFTPYAHFAGAFCTFDKETKTMFSSDIFGGLTDEFSLYAEDIGYFESLKLFHIHYMPSKAILNHTLLQIEKRNPEIIAPQHGSIIKKDLIKPIIDKMKKLNCGLYMLDEYESDIYLLNKTDELLKKFFEDVISLSSFDMILRNLFDYIENDIKSLNKISVCRINENKESIFYVVNKNHVLFRPKKQKDCEENPSLVKSLEKDGISIGKLKFYFDEIDERESKLLNIFLNKIIIPFSISFEKDLSLKNLKDKSMKDSLTNLFNRNYMNSVLKKKIEDSIQNDFPLSIAMIDIDYFKKVNDTYGHIYGDCVLKEISEIIQNSIRETDIAIRYGGEEILIVMPFTNIQGIHVKMEKIRETIEKHSFCDEKKIKVTVSIGIYQYKEEGIDEFINMADRKLYKAKKLGRNRVVS